MCSLYPLSNNTILYCSSGSSLLNGKNNSPSSYEDELFPRYHFFLPIPRSISLTKCHPTSFTITGAPVRTYLPSQFSSATPKPSSICFLPLPLSDAVYLHREILCRNYTNVLYFSMCLCFYNYYFLFIICSFCLKINLFRKFTIFQPSKK